MEFIEKKHKMLSKYDQYKVLDCSEYMEMKIVSIGLMKQTLKSFIVQLIFSLLLEYRELC